jgi:hypothetical protein
MKVYVVTCTEYGSMDDSAFTYVNKVFKSKISAQEYVKKVSKMYDLDCTECDLED